MEEEGLLPIRVWGYMLTVFSAAATAIQHICMAKALIREHDLRVMHMGPDSDRHARRLNVRLLEITMSSLFSLSISISTNSPRNNVTDNQTGRSHGKPQRSLRNRFIGGR